MPLPWVLGTPLLGGEVIRRTQPPTTRRLMVGLLIAFLLEGDSSHRNNRSQKEPIHRRDFSEEQFDELGRLGLAILFGIRCLLGNGGPLFRFLDYRRDYCRVSLLTLGFRFALNLCK